MYRFRIERLFLVLVSTMFLLVAHCAYAAPDDVVDLNGDTHHNPPSSTTDQTISTPSSGQADPNGGKPLSKEDRDSRDAAKGKAAGKELKLRAGEKVGSSARGAAQVLGMALQEGARDHVKVVDVTMNSPAFDAGVMKGDEITTFQGFRGENYRSWIDGIQRLTTDTGAGLKIPVVLTRGGKQLTVGITVPERIARSSSPRGQMPQGVSPPGSIPETPNGIPAGPAVGGNNVAAVIDNSGPFGEFFGGPNASPKDSAVAQIVRIGGASTTNPESADAGVTSPNGGQTPRPNDSSQPTATPIRGGMRIGMAGFRDEAAGMIVMVDVGALPSGVYTVAIADPSVIGGAAVSGTAAANPSIQTPQKQDQSTQQAPPGQAEATSTPNVSGNSQATPSEQVAQNITAVNGSLGQIGTITVDQTGTGKLQQKVESSQVRSLLGQAIVLYSSTENAGTNVTVNQQKSVGSAAPSSQPKGLGAPVPVAGGIIQLITDHRPPETAPTQPAPPAISGNKPAGQSTKNTPQPEQELVR